MVCELLGETFSFIKSMQAVNNHAINRMFEFNSIGKNWALSP